MHNTKCWSYLFMHVLYLVVYLAVQGSQGSTGGVRRRSQGPPTAYPVLLPGGVRRADAAVLGP